MNVESSGYGAQMQMQRAAISSGERRTELRIGGEPAGPKDAEQAAGPSFGKVLEDTAMAASDKEREAVAKAEALAAGTSDDLHGTMISMKEADISMKLVGSVRDKLMDAFHELWRINV